MEPREPIDIKILEDELPKDDIEIKVLETPLSEVDRITRQTGLPIRTVEDVKEVIEPPLVKAGQILFTKGMRTIHSSANRLHVEAGSSDAAHLVVDAEDLSLANLAIAEDLAASHDTSRGYEVVIESPSEGQRTRSGITTSKKIVTLSIPMEEGITLEEIERRSVDFANHFEPNDLIKIEVP